jgi:prevent-host-death family protein
MMKKVTFTDFRENASSYLDDVEDGQTIQISRHGKVIAEIVPPSADKGLPAWKKEGLQLATKGAGLSRAIIEEREQQS